MRVRRSVAIALAAVALCGVVAAAILALGGGSEPSREPNLTPAEQAKRILAPSDADPGGDETADLTLPPKGKWFGFSGGAFAWTGSHPELDLGLTAGRTVSDAFAVGANSARVDVAWVDLEPVQNQVGQGYLEKLDDFIGGIEKGGGRALLVLGGTPPWAAEFPGQQGSPPRDDAAATAAFARYATFVAKRWPRAAGIETWNEPNGILGWKPRPDPRRYARLHRIAARAIRKAAPDTKVVLGGLAAVPADNATFMRPQKFLKRMYAAGLKPSDYDGLALHPYPIQGPPLQSLDGGDFARSIDDFRLGYEWRDPDAELWVTETGVTTTGPQAASREAQAEGIVAVTRKLLTMPDVAGVWLHTQYEWDWADPNSPEYGFGVLQSRKAATPKPKPAFCALGRLAAKHKTFRGCA